MKVKRYATLKIHYTTTMKGFSENTWDNVELSEDALIFLLRNAGCKNPIHAITMIEVSFTQQWEADDSD